MLVDVLFALAILTSDSPVSDAEIEMFRPAILAICEAAEVSDKRERNFLLNTELQISLETLRERWASLAAAPHVDECRKFPDHNFVNDYLAINRQRRELVVKLGAVNSMWRDECDAEVARLDSEYETWNSVREAQCEYYWVAIRRRALMNVRNMFGDEAWFAGRLP